MFAKRFIPRGTIVFFECPKCRVIPRAKFQKLSLRQKERLLFHAYTRKDGSVVMPCGLSPYMNHSCDANVLDTGRGFDIVVRDIRKGREATYDYRVFYDENWGFECRCGAEGCCGTFRCQHPLPRGLRQEWNLKLGPALEQALKVTQPLKKELAASLPKTRRLLGWAGP